MDSLSDEDPYRILNLDDGEVDVLELTEQDIKRGYRRAALRWHPDKNPDDARAAHNFTRVFLAYETLSSPATRRLHDGKIRAHRQRNRRFADMDARRRGVREDLERREAEQGLATRKEMDHDAMERMRREIERLRTEGLEVREVRREPAKRSKEAETAGDNPWATVEGYDAFAGNGGEKVAFDDFEKSILAAVGVDSE